MLMGGYWQHDENSDLEERLQEAGNRLKYVRIVLGRLRSGSDESVACLLARVRLCASKL